MTGSLACALGWGRQPNLYPRDQKSAFPWWLATSMRCSTVF
jgi:hypothetical protein